MGRGKKRVGQEVTGWVEDMGEGRSRERRTASDQGACYLLGSWDIYRTGKPFIRHQEEQQVAGR